MLLKSVQVLCKSQGTNITKLERELQFGNGSIRKWGTSYPGVDKLEKVCDYFNVSLDEIMGRKVFKPSEQASNLATTFDGLPKEKQDLIKCYISVIQSN